MIEALDYFRELNTVSVLLRLTLAMLLGGMIGLNRGRKRRPAGFRTYMLVCLGAALTMILGQYEHYILSTLWEGRYGLRTDISRIGAQVINGIGFLGAGTVLVTGKQEAKGLTTAAGLWASASMGLTIGAGFYECVALAFLLIFLAVWLLPRLEVFIIERSRNINIYVEFTSLDDIGQIIACIKAHNSHIYDVDINRDKERARPSAILSVRLEERMPHTKLLADISALDCIYSIEET